MILQVKRIKRDETAKEVADKYINSWSTGRDNAETCPGIRSRANIAAIILYKPETTRDYAEREEQEKTWISRKKSREFIDSKIYFKFASRLW